MSKFYMEKLRRPKDISTKTIRGIATLWADNDDGIEELYYQCVGVYYDHGGDYTIVRSYCVMRELEKCQKSGMEFDKDRINEMLTSKDREMSELGMEMVYALRTERLNKEYDE